MKRFHWGRYVGRNIRVHVADKRDGTSVQGVLVYCSKQILVLRGASVPQVLDRSPVPIEGEVVIERSSVIFVEVP